MSLRARLIATLLAVAAVGMVVLAAVTYASQRSYQRDRIDDQARAALPAVDFALDDQGVPPGGGFPFRRRGHGGPGPADANLPPGTYGQRRSLDGTLIASETFGYTTTTLSPPDLPSRITIGHLFTVDAESEDLHYRVFADLRGGGVTIVAIPLAEVDKTLSNLLLVEAIVIAVVLALLGVGAWFLVRLGLRPLDEMGETAGAIAAGDLSRRVEVDNPRTEVGRLGTALNAMLARLETAFRRREESEQRLRTFLSDASHELRTPLASIRGYAELHRIGATGPDDVERSMRRIEDEASRMGVLVEDLLTLARMDEAPELVREPVDLAELAEDAADDARAMDPTRAVNAELADDAIVLGDESRLRQVLANLVRNAVVHTPAGSEIEISARRNGEHAELEVRDHGPGLPDGGNGELFERFWRAEGGRERGKAGAGLGLAIVAAIVHGHGGEVSATNAPGGGASFRVRLPLAADGEDAVAARQP